MTLFGEALVEAREARGLSATELADAIDVRRETIYRWERGDAEPSPTKFLDLLRCLDLPAKFFQMPAPASSLGPIYYRSLPSVRRASEVRTAERRLGWLREIVAGLERFIDFPQLNLIPFSGPSDPIDLDPGIIDQLASELRRAWGLGSGAITAMPWLLDNAGIVVSRNHLGVRAIDAFSQYGFGGTRPIIILANEGVSPAHIQADCAHELGHLVLHRNVDKRHIFDRERYRLMEDQAWAFARCFLLPADSFRESVGSVTLDHLAQLKLSWFVSIAIMIKRSEDVGLIDKTTARHLWIMRQNRKWTKVEPYDDRINIERPRLLKEAVEELLKAGGKYVREWLSGLRLGIDDIARYTDIDHQTLLEAERVPPMQVRLRAYA